MVANQESLEEAFAANERETWNQLLGRKGQPKS